MVKVEIDKYKKQLIIRLDEKPTHWVVDILNSLGLSYKEMWATQYYVTETKPPYLPNMIPAYVVEYEQEDNLLIKFASYLIEKIDLAIEQFKDDTELIDDINDFWYKGS